MKGKEGTLVSNTDAIDIMVSNKLFAVGYLMDIFCILNFENYATYGFQGLSREFTDRLFKAFRKCNLHTPNQFSNACCSDAVKGCFPSGSVLERYS